MGSISPTAQTLVALTAVTERISTLPGSLTVTCDHVLPFQCRRRASSPLSGMFGADHGPARRELLRPQREARRLVTAEGGTQFHPGHGEWIAILRASGFTVYDLREIYAPPNATDHPYYQLATAEWARQWPVEEIWAALLTQ